MGFLRQIIQKKNARSKSTTNRLNTCFYPVYCHAARVVEDVHVRTNLSRNVKKLFQRAVAEPGRARNTGRVRVVDHDAGVQFHFVERDVSLSCCSMNDVRL